MAVPLMSLLAPGTIRHVVPWKTRDEFLAVYKDLYNEEENLQEHAIRKIALWKSRAGSKLSVAIESTGMLKQAYLDHVIAEREGKLQIRDAQLRSSYSLALIRFVNQVTEKGQTKATAQPVHLIAREFGIPEWVVRLRHDATHSALPCLDVLATGTAWALSYLKENFWKHQIVEAQGPDKSVDVLPKTPKMSDIRRAFYDFQKVRYKELNADVRDKNESSISHTDALKMLCKYLTQDKLKFIRCLLEDGILISTQEQLAVFGIDPDDLMCKLPPAIHQDIVEFWRPLLKKLNNLGVLSFLIQTAMFSVTSGEGIRNYQLVAWIAYIISHHSDEHSKGRKKKKKKQESSHKTATVLPSKTLLSACLQNVNGLTAYLLNFLTDRESLGAESYNKLMKLLDVHSGVTSRSTSSDESGSDNIYTVEDIKRACEKVSTSKEITCNTVSNIQSISGDDIPWKICTDIVDWSSVPLGTLPSLTANEDDDNDDKGDDINQDASADTFSLSKGRGSSCDSDTYDDNDDDDDDTYMTSRRKVSSKRNSNHENDDDSDSDNSSNSFSHISNSKRCKLVTDSQLM